MKTFKTTALNTRVFFAGSTNIPQNFANSSKKWHFWLNDKNRNGDP